MERYFTPRCEGVDLKMSTCPFLAFSERLRLTGRRKPLPLTQSADAFLHLLQSEKEAPPVPHARFRQVAQSIQKTGNYSLTFLNSATAVGWLGEIVFAASADFSGPSWML